MRKTRLVSQPIGDLDKSHSGLTSGVIALWAAVLFVFVLWFDTVVLGFPILAEDTHPNGSGPFLLRGAILAVAAGLLFLSIARLRRNGGPRPMAEPAWFEQHLRWGALAVVLLSVSLFLVDARQFYRLGKEGRFVEQASAALLFAASACFLWLSVRLAQIRPRKQKLLILASLSLGGLFFLIGIEELSWFQRVLGLETPDMIRQLSERDEINIHNMHTALSEISYYFGAFIFLVIVPLVHERTNLFERIGGLSVLIPTRTATLVAAPAFAFNYVFWNLTFTQFAFWFTLLVLVFYTWGAWNKPAGPWQDRVFTLAVLAAFVFAQLVFMYGGERFVRIWDVTEYRELIVPIGFLVYALLTVRRVRITTKMFPRASLLASPYVMILALFLLTTLNYVLYRNVARSELDILVLAKQFAHPDFMPGELFLNESGTPRTAFLVLIYPLVRVFPLVVVSIVGRLLGYLLLSIGLGLIARRIGLNALSTCVVIGIYLWLGQSFLPDSDGIFEEFEAMQIAYGLLFLGLYALVDRRVGRAALLSGLATSLHFIVGGWGSLALGLTALSQRMGTWRERCTALVLWLMGASVGLYYVLSFWWEPASDSPFDAARIYVYFRNPHHFVPSSWDIEWYALLIGALLLWVLARVRTYYPRQTEPVVIARFVFWSLVPYVCGLLVVPFDFAPKFLQAGPFRVGSTLLIVFGLMLAVPAVLRYVFRKEPRRWLMAAAVAYFFWLAAGSFVDGFSELREFPEGALQGGAKKTRYLYDVCRWIREYTEPGALLITSPADQPVTYLCRRPVVVRFKSIPYRKANIPEWYSRLIDFNGGDEPTRTDFSASKEIAAKFRNLSAEAYRDLARKYGGKYLLVRSRDDLDLPKLYDNGRYAVFALDADSTVISNQ